MNLMSSVIPEVLYESPVPDHGIQCLDVARQIVSLIARDLIQRTTVEMRDLFARLYFKDLNSVPPPTIH